MSAKDRLDQLLNRLVVAGVPGCALSVGYKGRIVYSGCSGYANVEERKPMTENTVLRLASLTKVITATAVMTLYEKGYFLLDDPLYAYLPFFKDVKYQKYDASTETVVLPVSRPITIRDLLSMTSGIPYMGKGSLTSEQYLDVLGGYKASHSLTVMELAERISQVPLMFDPGTHWQYGYNYEVLGAVIEVLTGMRFSEYLQKEIFDPLGMNRTSFYITEELARDAATVYHYRDGKLVSMPRTIVSAPENSRLESGGGGLVSTLNDLAAFAGMLGNGGKWNGNRIISRNTLKLMSTNQLHGIALQDFQNMARDVYPWYTGYGWGLAGRTAIDPVVAGSNGPAGEFGWCGSAGPYMIADPGSGLGVIYAQQLAPAIGGMQDYCHPRIRNAVYSLLDEWEEDS